MLTSGEYIDNVLMHDSTTFALNVNLRMTFKAEMYLISIPGLNPYSLKCVGARQNQTNKEKKPKQKQK
jgi:hypothetical protein